MRFLNPAGLWLLLGIPVLIVIYLIRAQHEDRPVSSTFIWKLSSRFMKKRLPVQRIRKLLTFLLQLLIIVSAAFLASRPAAVNGKSCDYIAIIDASASMQTVDDTGTSRFEYALDEVRKLSQQTQKGHTVSVMVAGDTASWLLKQSSSKKEVRLALEQAAVTYGGCDTQEALSLAGEFCADSPNPQILFYTDNAYSELKNVQLIDLDRGEWNVSVDNVAARQGELGMVFTADLRSCNRDAFVTAALRIDGIVSDIQRVECVKDALTTVTFTAEEITGYETAEVFLEAADGLQADNSYAICKKRARTCNVLLVSQSPLYLKSALEALGSCKVTVAATADREQLTGYDLYVFDNVAPQRYPTDGSVLVFGTQLLPDGLQAAGEVLQQVPLSAAPEGESPLYEGLSLTDTVISGYVPLRGSLKWQELFFCGDDPVAVTRDMGSGTQFTLISFDLHHSNLPMQADFLVLMNNLVEFSVPAFLRETDHVAGSTVSFTVLPQAKQLYVQYPDGSVQDLPITSGAASLTADRVGLHTAVMTLGEGGEYADFFVHVPREETVKNTFPSLTAELFTTQSSQPEDAVSEVWFWLALGLLLLVLTEWGWYYREQY